MIHLLWKTVRQFLEMLNLELPCDSAVLFLDLVFLFSSDGQVVMILELKRGTGSVGLCFLSGLSPDLISDSQTLK